MPMEDASLALAQNASIPRPRAPFSWVCYIPLHRNGFFHTLRGQFCYILPATPLSWRVLPLAAFCARIAAYRLFCGSAILRLVAAQLLKRRPRRSPTKLRR